MSGEGGLEPAEYDILLQDLVDLSKESEVKQEQITEQKKALADVGKQKALDIRDMAIKNLKESQQVLKDGPSSEKRSRRSSSDTFSFLKEKLEYDKEFRERVKINAGRKNRVSGCDDSTTTSTTTSIKWSFKNFYTVKSSTFGAASYDATTNPCTDGSTTAADANFHGTT